MAIVQAGLSAYWLWKFEWLYPVGVRCEHKKWKEPEGENLFIYFWEVCTSMKIGPIISRFCSLWSQKKKRRQREMAFTILIKIYKYYKMLVMLTMINLVSVKDLQSW